MAAAFPRLVVTVVMSAATADNTVIVLPATGAVLEVNVELVWLPAEARLLTKVAHWVAVTVPPAATAVNDVCPQPLSPDPVAQMSLRPPELVVIVLYSDALINPPD